MLTQRDHSSTPVEDKLLFRTKRSSTVAPIFLYLPRTSSTYALWTCLFSFSFSASFSSLGSEPSLNWGLSSERLGSPFLKEKHNRFASTSLFNHTMSLFNKYTRAQVNEKHPLLLTAAGKISGCFSSLKVTISIALLGSTVYVQQIRCCPDI